MSSPKKTTSKPRAKKAAPVLSAEYLQEEAAAAAAVPASELESSIKSYMFSLDWRDEDGTHAPSMHVWPSTVQSGSTDGFSCERVEATHASLTLRGDDLERVGLLFRDALGDKWRTLYPLHLGLCVKENTVRVAMDPKSLAAEDRDGWKIYDIDGDDTMPRDQVESLIADLQAAIGVAPADSVQSVHVVKAPVELIPNGAFIQVQGNTYRLHRGIGIGKISGGQMSFRVGDGVYGIFLYRETNSELGPILLRVEAGEVLEWCTNVGEMSEGRHSEPTTENDIAAHGRTVKAGLVAEHQQTNTETSSVTPRITLAPGVEEQSRKLHVADLERQLHDIVPLLERAETLVTWRADLIAGSCDNWRDDLESADEVLDLADLGCRLRYAVQRVSDTVDEEEGDL